LADEPRGERDLPPGLGSDGAVRGEGGGDLLARMAMMQAAPVLEGACQQGLPDGCRWLFEQIGGGLVGGHLPVRQHGYRSAVDGCLTGRGFHLLIKSLRNLYGWAMSERDPSSSSRAGIAD